MILNLFAIGVFFQYQPAFFKNRQHRQGVHLGGEFDIFFKTNRSQTAAVFSLSYRLPDGGFVGPVQQQRQRAGIA